MVKAKIQLRAVLAHLYNLLRTSIRAIPTSVAKPCEQCFLDSTNRSACIDSGGVFRFCRIFRTAADCPEKIPATGRLFCQPLSKGHGFVIRQGLNPFPVNTAVGRFNIAFFSNHLQPIFSKQCQVLVKRRLRVFLHLFKHHKGEGQQVGLQ